MTMNTQQNSELDLSVDWETHEVMRPMIMTKYKKFLKKLKQEPKDDATVVQVKKVQFKFLVLEAQRSISLLKCYTLKGNIHVQYFNKIIVVLLEAYLAITILESRTFV